MLRILHERFPEVAILITMLVALVALPQRVEPAPTTIVVVATPTLGLPLQATPEAPGDAAALDPYVDTLPHAVVAYSAPDGVVLGPIEHGRPYTPMAVAEGGWMQINAVGSGLVWIQALDIAGGAGLPDMTPPAPPSTGSP